VGGKIEEMQERIENLETEVYWIWDEIDWFYDTIDTLNKTIKEPEISGSAKVQKYNIKKYFVFIRLLSLYH
jgi:hypothetical protein